MSEREELQKLRRLRELETREQKTLGLKLPGGLSVGVTGPVAEDPKGFTKNALQTAVARVAQLGSKLPGSSVDKQRAEERLKELESQPGGSTGVLLGDTLATLPFAGVAKGVQAGRALLGASKIGRVLTGKTAAAATEGAAAGGFLNDKPIEGATLSAALNLLARGAGKVASGPIAKSDEAQALQQVAAAEGIPLELPVAVAAKNPLVRKAFGDVLPVLPGAQKAMAGQQKNVQQQLDLLAGVRGAPSQETSALLGSDIRIPSDLEKRMAWGIASGTGVAPKVIPLAKAASSTPVNKALLGDYSVQKKIKEVGKKIKPLTEAIRRVVTLEATEDE